MYRKGVAALIVNTKQELLLVNLESFEEKYFSIPGGGQDKGESLEGAAYREIKEELDIDKHDLELVGMSNSPIVFDFKDKPMIREGITYVGQEKYYFGFKFVGDDKSIYPNDGEVRSYRWVPVSELDKYLLFENQLEHTMEKVKKIFG